MSGAGGDGSHLWGCRRRVGADRRAGRTTTTSIRRAAAKKVRHLAVAEEPIIGPGLDADEEVDVTLPRLARHQLTLPDGHTVGVAVCGRGVPLVVVHGFSAEGILYAQTLSRLVDLGFKVIAVDTAGHGGTLGLPTGAQSLASYAELLGRVLDHLGVKRHGAGRPHAWGAAWSPSWPPPSPIG